MEIPQKSCSFIFEEGEGGGEGRVHIEMAPPPPSFSHSLPRVKLSARINRAQAPDGFRASGPERPPGTFPCPCFSALNVQLFLSSG
jgi:hypothetical protein